MFNRKVFKKQTTNIKTMTTKALRSILADPYTRGVDGADYYHDRRLELEQELWRRDQRVSIELEEKQDRLALQYEAWEIEEKARLRAEIAALRLCPPENPETFLRLLERLKQDIEIVTKQDTCPFQWAIVVNDLKDAISAHQKSA